MKNKNARGTLKMLASAYDGRLAAPSFQGQDLAPRAETKIALQIVLVILLALGLQQTKLYMGNHT